jgi:hypothetical protein
MKFVIFVGADFFLRRGNVSEFGLLGVTVYQGAYVYIQSNLIIACHVLHSGFWIPNRKKKKVVRIFTLRVPVPKLLIRKRYYVLFLIPVFIVQVTKVGTVYLV